LSFKAHGTKEAARRARRRWGVFPDQRRRSPATA